MPASAYDSDSDEALVLLRSGWPTPHAVSAAKDGAEREEPSIRLEETAGGSRYFLRGPYRGPVAVASNSWNVLPSDEPAQGKVPPPDFAPSEVHPDALKAKTSPRDRKGSRDDDDDDSDDEEKK
mmetsp:Transcript_5079/g.16640  ORF Transcript_5079/g.16640 Transcript_5079/m.16640 type:complete len:124 (-) Transcript_5079:194-565(-)